jgi:hypothetical protein|tara:strand:+ start:1315 stop:1995 length:681 start_codon:yes stop_codon:yes gene_type:complete
MATSGSSDFEPDVAEYIEEAFERCGLEYRTGYDGVTARRSLNLLFADWANRGLNQWTVTNSVTTLSKSDQFLDLTATTIDVLDVVLRRTENSEVTDIQMNQISRSAYWNIPNKDTEARPSQWFLDKQITPRLYIWPAAENSTDKVIINRLVRIEDADAGVNTVNVPFRFYPCLSAGLAYYIALKRAPDRVQILKGIYEEEFARAADQDESRASLMVAPNLRSYRRA